MNKQEFDSLTYHKPSGREEKEAREKSGNRRFWFLCIPGGALGAFILCLISGSGGAFFPAWVVFAFLGYGLSIPEGK